MEKKQRNIFSTITRRKIKFQDILIDDSLRFRFQFVIIYILFTLVSGVMTVINLFTGFQALMWSTFAFSIASAINLFLALIHPTLEKVSHVLMAVEAIVLFTFFFINGEPEGFSIWWSLLVPVGGILLYGKLYGSIFAGVQFLSAVFFCWIPWGRNLLQFQYSESFLMRFPVIYIAFFAVGFFFEEVRSAASKELQRAKDNFRDMSIHDSLTGLRNRYGFNSAIAEMVEDRGKDGLAFAILDLDHFKNINDAYGHLNGDVVLKQTAEQIQALVGDDGVVCRWGGEEFAVLFDNSDKAETVCNALLKSRRNYTFRFGDALEVVTISIGLVTVPPGVEANQLGLVSQADTNLYASKRNGRDRLTLTVYNPVKENQK